jgi:predicted SAM-dependent methyltransferase
MKNMFSLRDMFWDQMDKHRGLRACWISVRSGVGVLFQRPAIRRYLRDTTGARLHLGAGRNVLPGWLNTDYLGHFPACLRLDVRKHFPFPDGTFQYVFSEHMIEHLSYDGGLHMLGECFRVLRPSGVIRVETPDLRRIVSVYEKPLDKNQLAYLQFHARVVRCRENYASPCVAINNAMRNWGHQFLYDEDTLRRALSLTGFDKIERVTTGWSTHAALNGLRNREWLETNAFETLALEATRPAVKRDGVGGNCKPEGSDHV